MTFYLATERNNQEIVKLLLEHDGNNPTRKTIENIGWPYSAVIKGRSVTGGPSQMAAWRGFVDLVAILLDAGAVVEGEELLMLARGQVQEALQAVGKKGAFPYHFHNQLPDYTDVVEVLRKHLARMRVSRAGSCRIRWAPRHYRPHDMARRHHWRLSARDSRRPIAHQESLCAINFLKVHTQRAIHSNTATAQHGTPRPWVLPKLSIQR